MAKDYSIQVRVKPRFTWTLMFLLFTLQYFPFGVQRRVLCSGWFNRLFIRAEIVKNESLV